MGKRTVIMGLIALLTGCAPMATEPPPGAVKAELGYPAVGTKWVVRSVEEPGETRTVTLTVLEEGTYKGKPVYRESTGTQTIMVDKATRNWIATIPEGKESPGASPVFTIGEASPHSGELSFPLWVGKSWVARYNWHDPVRGRSNEVMNWWRVAAYEEVTVPAGTFKAFRIEGGSQFEDFILWYSPELNFTVKRVWVRSSHHYRGAGKVTRELLEYGAR